MNDDIHIPPRAPDPHSRVRVMLNPADGLFMTGQEHRRSDLDFWHGLRWGLPISMGIIALSYGILAALL